MADHPALFSTPMVRANRAGLKRMTRRIIKHPEHWGCLTGDCPHWKEEQCALWIAESVTPHAPWGKPGDSIWVRETWAKSDAGVLYRADPMFDGMKPGDFAWKWKPSIHMPRWASRDSYVITDVRAERLQDISADDAIAEGIQFTDYPDGSKLYADYVAGDWTASPIDSYESLWESINGPGDWARNPWVMVYTYDNPACKGVLHVAE